MAEAAMVIMIIVIMIAGVPSIVRLYNDMKLSTARNLTTNSRVARIPNLVAWYETTLENNFSTGTTSYSDIDKVSENQPVNRWKDISPTSSTKSHATQNISDNQPVAMVDRVLSLPVVNFTSSSSQFLNLPDGTVPYGDSPYTVIIVSRVSSFGSYGVLGSGNYSNKSANCFEYNNRAFRNCWQASDTNLSNSVVVKKFQIFSLNYDQSKREGYVDGVLENTKNSSGRQSTRINNMIGRVNNQYMEGDIAEIIIYDRALSTKERQEIEAYLAKKWSIKI